MQRGFRIGLAIVGIAFLLGGVAISQDVKYNSMPGTNLCPASEQGYGRVADTISRTSIEGRWQLALAKDDRRLIVIVAHFRIAGG